MVELRRSSTCVDAHLLVGALHASAQEAVVGLADVVAPDSGSRVQVLVTNLNVRKVDSPCKRGNSNGAQINGNVFTCKFT